MDTAQLESPRGKTASAPVETKPHQRSSWWVYLILILVVAGFGYFVYTRLVSAKAAAAAASAKQRAVHDLPVVVAFSHRGELDQYLVGLGTVTPLSTVTLKSRVDGAITQLNFEEGQMVQKDQFLLQIDPRPYQATLDQAKGQLAKDQATEKGADWNVDQDTIALKDKGISQQQLITDTATRDSAKGAVLVDQANIEAAQINIDYAHLVSPISGRIGLRQVDLGNIVHAADTTGLAVIAQLQPITVVFTLPEDNISQIQKRMARGEPLTVDAYDRDLTQKIASGSLLAIDNQIDPTTGTVKIKAKFDNKNNELFPNEFVNARMLVNTVRDAVLVPTSAIQHSPGSTFVYVVKKDDSPPKDSQSTAAGSAVTSSGTAYASTAPTSRPAGIGGVVSMREVTLGPSQAAVASDGEDTTVIASGLEPGEMVVTDGVDKLQEGTRVLARPATKTVGSHGASTMEAATTKPAGRHKRPTTSENNE